MNKQIRKIIRWITATKSQHRMLTAEHISEGLNKTRKITI